MKNTDDSLSEIQIQAKAYQYLHNNYPQLRGLLFHVPNGGNRNKIEGMQLKAAGVIPGVPDLLLVWRGKVNWIEVKTTSGSVSPIQAHIHQVWVENGAKGTIARSAEEIIEFVLDMIGENPK